MTGFVYCWTDHKTNKLYIGSHKGTEDDGYVCSSKSMLKEYSERCGDFTRQIIAHGPYPDMRNLEYKILKSANASHNEAFYNMHNGASNFFITEEAKKKSVDTKRKKGTYRPENNPMFGKKHTEEVKRKHSERMSGSNNPNYKKVFSEDTIKKMALARKLYWDKKKGLI